MVFYDFAYEIQGRDKFTQEVLDENENELEFDEVWLLGSITDRLDLKAGRQIVVWGKSDNIRVTDVLNPLDLREPGLTDLENLRLPVTMTKLDYFMWGLKPIGVWSFMKFVTTKTRNSAAIFFRPPKRCQQMKRPIQDLISIIPNLPWRFMESFTAGMRHFTVPIFMTTPPTLITIQAAVQN